ncbi:MAG: HEAT repeat domain-containing protein [Candidatus Brocadiia bacterium]
MAPPARSVAHRIAGLFPDNICWLDQTEALISIGDGGKAVVDPLLELGKHPDQVEIVRSEALRTLGHLEADRTYIVPRLLRVLELDLHPETRGACLKALGRLARDDERVLLTILQATESDHSQVRRAALHALGMLESDDPRVIARLLEAVSSPDEETRSGAVLGLGANPDRDQRAVAALTARLSDESERVQRGAVVALGRFGRRAAPAAESLTALLEQEGLSWFRGEQLETLVAIGPAARIAIPALEAVEPKVRRWGNLEAISQFGSATAQGPPPAGHYRRLPLVPEAYWQLQDALARIRRAGGED